jgi:ankyrin repeat protein
MVTVGIWPRFTIVHAPNVISDAGCQVHGGSVRNFLRSLRDCRIISLLCVAIGISLGAAGMAGAGSLSKAANQGDLSTVEKLLGEGVEVDQRARNAATPLITAALAGNAVIAKVLITHGADIMARNKGGLTPLHAAAYSGSVEIARLLLEHGADLKDRKNVSGATPLMLTAEEGHVAVAELLIARGGDPLVTDREGFTALIWAWTKKRTGMVRLLKSHGATCPPAEVLGSAELHQQ